MTRSGIRPHPFRIVHPRQRPDPHRQSTRQAHSSGHLSARGTSPSISGAIYLRSRRRQPHVVNGTAETRQFLLQSRFATGDDHALEKASPLVREAHVAGIQFTGTAGDQCSIVAERARHVAPLREHDRRRPAGKVAEGEGLKAAGRPAGSTTRSVSMTDRDFLFTAGP